MKAVFLRGCALFVAASLAGCTTGGGGAPAGADVTRFHLGQQIARAQIAVEPTNQADANSLEFRTYADAVARQLTRLGWTVVDTRGQSEQVALIDVEQGTREAIAQRPPISIGIGGGTGGYRSGVGAGLSFGVGGGGRGGEIVGTLLEVRIKRRSEGTVFWEGRATTEARAGTPGAERTVAVEKLAEALFRDFPGESGRTIRVR
jgi:hypothetical protein